MNKSTEQASGQESEYAKKVAAGNQMYGPGCCAHKVSPSQIAAAKKRAFDEGRMQR